MIIILYLIVVLINCYFIITYLLDNYNRGKVITVGMLFKHILICLLSWLYIIVMLVAWMCYPIYILSNKPLFKKKHGN